MNQGHEFANGEGDNWFRRNQYALAKAAEQDIPLKLLAEGIPPLDKSSTVFEVGCSSGWRLAKLQERYGSKGFGVDVSEAAVRAGLQQWPELTLSVCSAKDVDKWVEWLTASIDLVIVNFVLHWVARQELLASLTAIDKLVANRNFLLIGDFLPDSAEEVPYHHREGLWTYKHDYVSAFLPAGFRVRKEIIYDHDSLEIMPYNEIPSSRRAHATLLQKVYQWET
jgi:SAM-dependent methyltransferase